MVEKNFTESPQYIKKLKGAKVQTEFLIFPIYPEKIKRLGEKLVPHRITIFIAIALAIILPLLFWGAQDAGKTFWDIFEITIIPVVIGVIAWLFNRAAKARDHVIETDRQRQNILADYFDCMSDLILNKELLSSEENSEVRTIARARTISALSSLDESRIVQVIKFLSDSDLGNEKLTQIYLPEVDFKGFSLIGAKLARANLMMASLEKAYIYATDFKRAILVYANLKSARIEACRFYGADLGRADLSGVNITETHPGDESDFTGVNLEYANLKKADIMGQFNKANLKYANLESGWFTGAEFDSANLKGANLKFTNCLGVNFENADFTEANMKGSNLQGANLKGAILEMTDLTDALVTKDELAEVKTLQKAIMPSGMIYEDWISKNKPDWTTDKRWEKIRNKWDKKWESHMQEYEEYSVVAIDHTKKI